MRLSGTPNIPSITEKHVMTSDCVMCHNNFNDLWMCRKYCSGGKSLWGFEHVWKREKQHETILTAVDLKVQSISSSQASISSRKCTHIGRYKLGCNITILDHCRCILFRWSSPTWQITLCLCPPTSSHRCYAIWMREGDNGKQLHLSTLRNGTDMKWCDMNPAKTVWGQRIIYVNQSFVCNPWKTSRKTLRRTYQGLEPAAKLWGGFT